MAQRWIERGVCGGALVLAWVLLLAFGCQTAPSPLEMPTEAAAHRGGVDGLGEAVMAVAPRDPDHPAQLRHCPGSGFEPTPLPEWQVQRANSAQPKNLVPRHRLDDLVVSLGQPVRLVGHIAYGDPHREETKTWVRIYLGDCKGWRQVAHRKSDDLGEVVYAMERRLPLGVYGIAIQVAQDATFATASLWVVPRTTPVVLFDLSTQGQPSPRGEDAGDSTYLAELTRIYQSTGFLVVYVLAPDQKAQPWDELLTGGVDGAPVVGPVFRRASPRGRAGGEPPGMGDHPVTLLKRAGLEVVRNYQGPEAQRYYGFRRFP